MCINYANEKLQQKFTHDVFKSVQQEYEQVVINFRVVRSPMFDFLTHSLDFGANFFTCILGFLT